MQKGDESARSEAILAHFASITEWMQLDREDHTLVGDTVNLERNCAEFPEMIDRILELPLSEETRDELATHVAHLLAAVDWVKRTCEDLERPLDRLLERLCDDEPEDDAPGPG